MNSHSRPENRTATDTCSGFGRKIGGWWRSQFYAEMARPKGDRTLTPKFVVCGRPLPRTFHRQYRSVTSLEKSFGGASYRGGHQFSCIRGNHQAHDQAASSSPSASKLLPKADVIQLPTSKRAVRPLGGFTKNSIRRMHCPNGSAEKLFWDATCPGFGLRALKSGRRCWIYQYRDEHRRTRRIVLGDASVVSLDAAQKPPANTRRG